ncbi:MAG: hypothetical protein N2Z80_05070 [Hydrogenothermaceae bacterium]|nr:hypothetical protein [Hydrogenothermaceae bacterium]
MKKFVLGVSAAVLSSALLFSCQKKEEQPAPAEQQAAPAPAEQQAAPAPAEQQAAPAGEQKK